MQAQGRSTLSSSLRQLYWVSMCGRGCVSSEHAYVHGADPLQGRYWSCNAHCECVYNPPEKQCHESVKHDCENRAKTNLRLWFDPKECKCVDRGECIFLFYLCRLSVLMV